MSTIVIVGDIKIKTTSDGVSIEVDSNDRWENPPSSIKIRKSQISDVIKGLREIENGIQLSYNDWP